MIIIREPFFISVKASSGGITARKVILFPTYTAKSYEKTMKMSPRRNNTNPHHTESTANREIKKLNNEKGEGHHLKVSSGDHAKSNKSENKKPSNVLPFQSAIAEEFPTADDKKEPRIPHIFHQIYADEMIPTAYVKLVKSFITYNPTWEYRFWTDASGRQLLQKHHPYLLRVFDGFGNNVRRSDLLRYVVLYEYGGFYADFDTQTLRSLNKTTMKYASIFPVEPFEHSVMLYNRSFIINNAIMGCRPKHPFLKLLLSDLRKANLKGNPILETGPLYVTRKFIQYNHMENGRDDKNKTDFSSNSPYFYKGELREDDDNAVYVPNSQYFMDKIDPSHLTEHGIITRLCIHRHARSLPYLKRRGCIEFESRKRVREEGNYTFTVHHWYHIWIKAGSKIKHSKKVHIKDIVPKCIQYNYTG